MILKLFPNLNGSKSSTLLKETLWPDFGQTPPGSTQIKASHEPFPAHAHLQKARELAENIFLLKTPMMAKLSRSVCAIKYFHSFPFNVLLVLQA